MPELSVTVLAVAAFALALGGFAKGVTGVGLPMVALPLMSSVIPIKEAVALLYFPILATNFYQAFAGGHFRMALARFWPLLLFLCLFVWIGTWSLVKFDAAIVSMILGLAIAVFAALSLARPSFVIGPRWERPIGVVAGAAGGFFGGLALIGGPPVIMYYVALNLKKEEFISCIALVYLLTLVPAGFSFVSFGVLELRHVVPGLATIVPVVAGLFIGQWLRKRIDQDLFRKILLVSMVVIGLNLIRRGLF
ncbi:MAG: hypothetical protein RL477_2209 [Pseudomonadota bacterium]